MRDASCVSSFCTPLASFTSSQSSSYTTSNLVISPIVYADGSRVSGFQATDFISISNQTVKAIFVEATSLTAVNAGDGIMGLSISLSASQMMYYQQLYNSKMISVPIFTYFIGSDNVSGGVNFGQIDTARYAGEILWAPVIREVYSAQHWTVALGSITIGSNSISISSGFNFITDTGTSLAVFPSAIAARINSALGMTEVETDIWAMPCSSANNLPDMTFGLGM